MQSLEHLLVAFQGHWATALAEHLVPCLLCCMMQGCAAVRQDARLAPSVGRVGVCRITATAREVTLVLEPVSVIAWVFEQ